MKTLFLVISPPPHFYELCEDIVFRYAADMDHRKLTKEYGSKGDHEHLNLVFEWPYVMKKGRRHYKDFSNTRRSILSLFPTEVIRECIDTNGKNILLSLQQVEKRKGGLKGTLMYITKEPDHEVLIEGFTKVFKRKTQAQIQDKKESDSLQKQISSIIKELRLMIDPDAPHPTLDNLLKDIQSSKSYNC